MAWSDFVTHGRSIRNDGNGHIYIVNDDGSGETLFPYAGWEAAFCWGGNAIIWIDYYRLQGFVANLDGSGIYNLGVYAASPNKLYRARLAANNSIYILSADLGGGGLDVYKFGAAGYGLAQVVGGVTTAADVSKDGAFIAASKLWGPYSDGKNRHRLFVKAMDGSWQYNIGTYPGTLEGKAGYPDEWGISLNPVSASFNGNLFTCGDLSGVDFANPATFKTFDIARTEGAWGTGVTYLNACPQNGPGYMVTGPVWAPDSMVWLYQCDAGGYGGTYAKQTYPPYEQWMNWGAISNPNTIAYWPSVAYSR